MSWGTIKAPAPATMRVLVEQVGAKNGCQPPCRQPLIDYISKKSIDVYCGVRIFKKFLPECEIRPDLRQRQIEVKKLLYEFCFFT